MKSRNFVSTVVLEGIKRPTQYRVDVKERLKHYTICFAVM